MQIERINYQLLAEEESLRSSPTNNYELKQGILRALYKIGSGQDTKLSRAIGQTKQLLNVKALSHKQLENFYFDVCKKLNCGPRARESHPTFPEQQCAKYLKDFTRVKFYQSIWIGNHCVDFYLQRLGLVIEIDGGIHSSETKMKKDNYAEKEFKRSYKMCVARFNNEDISRLESTVFHLLRQSKKINTKAIRRRNRDIFINTMACHCSMADLANYLGSDLYFILAIYKKTHRNTKRIT